MKFNQLKCIVRAFALASFATGAHAVTDISTCQTISQPGSYRLTQNLQTDARDCLVIAVSNVTLDLHGHSVSGVRHLATKGVSSPFDLQVHDIVVRNGTIAFFGIGVGLSGSAYSVRVENLQVHGNASHGIQVGAGSVVSGNLVHDNGGFGIAVRSTSSTDGGLVTGNVVFDNNFDVILIEPPGSTVSGNTSRRNERDGIEVRCPANLQNNTSTNSPSGSVDIRFILTGCLDINNLAPKRATLQ
jgi:hypothetical protein